MAIIDAFALFSNDQAITADAASTDHYDLQEVRDLGPGCPLWVVITITETFDNLTSLAINLRVDDNDSFSSPTIIAGTGSIAAASLVAGARFAIAIPPNGIAVGGEQYMHVYYDVIGTNPANGKVHAYLSPNVPQDGDIVYQGQSYSGL